MEYIDLNVVNVRIKRKLKCYFNMEVKFILFIYGLLIILIFSMLALNCYKDWVNKKENFVDFVIFAVIDIITIIAFIAQFTN